MLNITDKFFAIKSSDGTHHLFVEHDTAFQHVGTLPPGEHLDLTKYPWISQTIAGSSCKEERRKVSIEWRRPRFQIGEQVKQGEIIDCKYLSADSAFVLSSIYPLGWLYKVKAGNEVISFPEHKLITCF